MMIRFWVLAISSEKALAYFICCHYVLAMRKPAPLPKTSPEQAAQNRVNAGASEEAPNKFIYDFDYDLLDSRGKEAPPQWNPHKAQFPDKLEGGKKFELVAPYEPAGDQPTAIEELVGGIKEGEQNQVLLGVTGSGKTYTMAQVISRLQRPALILAHNKTLAAQLYGEFKAFFPNNAVEYFVSYYDYYQPEAYVPRTDTYIEKESTVNEQIDRMRHSATRSLLERDDVIIVASVSCIYGIGSVESYSNMVIGVETGETCDLTQLTRELVSLQYKRNDIDFRRGTFRMRGDAIDIYPSHLEDSAWRISFFGDEVEKIIEFDPLTGKKTDEFKNVKIYANNHYTLPRPALSAAMIKIKNEMTARVEWLEKNGQLIEAQRINERVKFDLETMMATGFCSGIENYSRYLTGRKPGEPPPTLFEYLPQNALIFVDESHVSIPQIGAMFKGDYARKRTLSEYGFRLPSCMDNRPLRFEEWDAMRPQTVFVSATPGPWELNRTEGAFTEQVIRPTGLIDPPVEVRPVQAHGRTQVDDCLEECRLAVENGHRVLLTTLTKKMAEDLTDYLFEQGLKVRYMHSDVETIERIEIIRDLRNGVFDILVGINLLREGLDIPECGLVCILDADKEGFLRSQTSLIQTIGRAARNAEAKVILYADKITGSMERAMAETTRRRDKQIAHNIQHNITPKTIKSEVKDIMEQVYGQSAESKAKRADFARDEKIEAARLSKAGGHNIRAVIADLEKQMRAAAEELEFETAAKLRDEIHELERVELEM